jgi:hypothetical protein
LIPRIDFDHHVFSFSDERTSAVDTDVSPKEIGGDKPKIEIPEDAFLMVTQVNWEDDVIWNGDDIKHKVSINKRPVNANKTIL